MKILVCIKQVPDTESKIQVKSDGSGIETSGLKWIMNPYDEFAVEEAIKTKEADKESTVTLLSLGPKKRVLDSLRTGLAMGADDALLIDGPEGLDALTTAKALAKAAEQEGPFDMVFCGKLAIDDNASSVPQMVAEFLDIPHTTVVSKFEQAGDKVSVERDGDGGAKETVEMPKPSVVAANKGLNMPRYASLPGIMKAKKKPVKDLNFADLGVSAPEGRIQMSNFRLPPEKPPVKMLSGEPGEQVSELVSLLKNEAKVL